MVFRAHDPRLGRTVAIKVLAPYLSWEQGAAKRFLQEAKAVASLHHPNIIEIYDVGQDGTNLYFVMPYLEGPTLEQRLERTGKLDVPEVLSIAQQVASALDYAHGKGVVHRDVKPANVLFGKTGNAILTDFGIAKIAQGTKVTTMGGLIGSPEYMAPERILGQPVNERSDQYALAVLIFESLAGKVPFDADTPTAILYKHVHEPPPSLRPLCPQMPAVFDAALCRALAKAPEQRYDSCGVFVAALTQASKMAHRPRAWWPMRRGLRTGAVGGFAGIVVLAGFLLAWGAVGGGPFAVVSPTATPTLTSTLTEMPTTTLTKTPTTTSMPTDTTTPSPTPSDTAVPSSTPSDTATVIPAATRTLTRQVITRISWTATSVPPAATPMPPTPPPATAAPPTNPAATHEPPTAPLATKPPPAKTPRPAPTKTARP